MNNEETLDNTPTAEANSYMYNTKITCEWARLFSDSCFQSQYTSDEIREYINHPAIYQKELRELGWWAYRVDGSVSSAVDYLRTMHTLDKTVVCKSRTLDGKKPRSFNKNKQLMLNTLEVIKYKEKIRDALLKRCNDGIYFYYFETSAVNSITKKFLNDIDVERIYEINELGINASIISLPVDWCKIVGKKNNAFVVAFDLKYFLQFDEHKRDMELLKFPKEIRDGFKKNEKHIGDKSWIVLDNNRTIVDKGKTPDNVPYGIPLAICALDDILYANYFVQTKRNVLDSVNSQIIYEVFPEGEKGKCTLTSNQQKEQHGIIKEAIVNKKNKNGVAFFSLAAGTKMDSIKVDTDILDEKNENTIKNSVPRDLGISSASLNGEATGNYATASLNIEMVAGNVYSWIENFMNELNKCINANIIKDKRCKIACNILPVTYVNRDKFFNQMKALYSECNGSFMAVIAASGMDVESYLSLLDEEKELNFDEKYMPHASMHTQSSSDNKGGRPSISDSEVKNENTLASKSINGNANPKPNA